MIFDPSRQLIGILHQEVVSLRMSEHRNHAAVQKLKEYAVDASRNGDVGKFHEQVVPVVDGELGRIRERRLDIGEVQMEVAAPVKSRQGLSGSFQFRDFRFDPLRIERVLGVRVRRPRQYPSFPPRLPREISRDSPRTSQNRRRVPRARASECLPWQFHR